MYDTQRAHSMPMDTQALPPGVQKGSFTSNVQQPSIVKQACSAPVGVSVVGVTVVGVTVVGVGVAGATVAA